MARKRAIANKGIDFGRVWLPTTIMHGLFTAFSSTEKSPDPVYSKKEATTSSSHLKPL